MKDGPEEISGVLNLLLPMNKLLPFDEQFEAEFFNTDKKGIMTLKPSMIERLKDAIRGRVSYLGEIRGDVRKEFLGKKIGDLKHFIVNPIKMIILKKEYIQIHDRLLFLFFLMVHTEQRDLTNLS
jgi:hypothetical protein